MPRPRLLVPLLLAASALPALAQDLSWSVFGTLGYARSDRDYTYQRSIDDSGTFDRDSLLGAQADLRLSPQWSATMQLKLAPSLKRDSQWDLTPAWAFVGWRPSNDWLLRAGRMRVPLYLHSESMDVGVTHDLARLPTEMYSIAPSTDFDGLSAAKTWALGDNELSLDVYSGQITTSARFWLRDGLPPQMPAGQNYVDVKVRSSGLAMTLRGSDGIWRASVLRTATRRKNGENISVRYPFVQLAPGLGYYQVDEAIPGPGMAAIGSIHNTIVTLGFEQNLGSGWRLAGEYARDKQHDTEVGSDTRGGYLALLRQIGRTTPYISFGVLRASQGQLDWYRRLTETQLPPMIPGADMLNAAQRVAAENIYAVDQRSLALGASVALNPSQKLKVEWMRTRIGQVSRLIDTPAGRETPHDTHVDVWSVHYSFSF